MGLRFVLISIFVFAYMSCGSTKQTVKKFPQRTSYENKRAVDHYLAGALFDFRDQYHEALREYHNALKYDTTSAQILKAIGRDLSRIEQYEAGIAYLKRSYGANPADRETLYYLAEGYYRINDKKNAALYFEKLNEIDPYNSSVCSTLIYLYTHLGETDKLITLREKMVELYGYQDESVYQLVNLYLSLNKLAEAQQLARKLIEEAPNKPENWIILGSILEMQNDQEGAIGAYHRALELNADDEKTLNQLFLLYSDKQDWQGLTNTFRQLVDYDSANNQARLFLGEGYFYLKEYKQAKNTVTSLLKEEGFEGPAHQLLGRIAVAEDSLEEAKVHFKTLTGLQPKNSRAWEFLAILYLQNQEYLETLEVLEEAFSIIQNDPQLLSLYGNALQQLERYDEALIHLRKAYEIEPRDLNTIVSLGIVYEELRRYSALDSLYEAALKVFPENSLLLNNYSYSLCERGIRLEKALEMAVKAVDKEPDNGAYLDTMGWIYYKLGRYEEALKHIQQAVLLREESAVVIEHLGDVYFKLGNVTMAEKYWRQAAEKDPENPALQKKLEH